MTCLCKFVGTQIYGYCNGFFGRDSLETKIIEAVGRDWIVAREIYSGNVVFAEFSEDYNKILEYVTEWQDPEQEI